MDRRIAEEDKSVTRKCTKCGKDKPLTDFVKEKTRADGRRLSCKACRQAVHRAWTKTPSGKRSVRKYEQSEKGQASNRRHRQTEKGKATILRGVKTYRDKHPDRYKATNILNGAIRHGKFPAADTCECSVRLELCLGRASQYHHHNGYDEEHIYDVIPVCRSCHRILDQWQAAMPKYLGEIYGRPIDNRTIRVEIGAASA